MTRVVFRIVTFILIGIGLVACGGETSSFSLLEDSDSFTQNNATNTNTKIDILWVVDNSGSMASSQANVAANFQSFIEDFSTKGLDYQIGVITTEAYKTAFSGGSWSNLRSNSGFSILTPSTPNIENAFIQNITQGTNGTGDERAFHSFETSLEDMDNAGFLRPDAFLAVIIVSDEDDFSHDYSYFSSSNLHPIQDYVDYLDAKTSSSGATRRYSVSSMSIWDSACLSMLSGNGQKIAVRYGDLVDATGGIKGSLCGNFAQELSDISNNILSLATQFYLSRIPVESSIVVKVNGALVPHSDSNPGPSTGGWKYDSNANSIIFYGDYIPAQGASIDISYDPVNYGS